MNSPVQSTAPAGVNVTTTTGAPATYNPSRSTVGGPFAPVVPGSSSPTRRRSFIKHSTQNVESAVYAYIQAIRALGITRTNTLEIAKALGLTQTMVEKTISSITKKGVKVISG
jgi:hypothetical protein